MFLACWIQAHPCFVRHVWGDIKVADLERVIQFWSVRLEAEPTPAALPLEAKMDLLATL